MTTARFLVVFAVLFAVSLGCSAWLVETLGSAVELGASRPFVVVMGGLILLVVLVSTVLWHPPAPRRSGRGIDVGR